MKRMNRPHRKDQRREDALIRQIAFNMRSREQHLARLIERGHGHCHEARELQS